MVRPVDQRYLQQCPFMGKRRFLFIHLALEFFDMVIDIRNLLFQHRQVDIGFPQIAKAFIIFLDGVLITAFVLLQF